ncbi:tetratricopeptide repeat protein [Spirochaeta isovalerica]|uniref:Tetratricopeptide (TPR) repeat protein n=1 Tax=Spirochaeta isovalerica TaxID=150 RepID=A0A841RBM3_9SPIO|nr:tetratricopeptide repeat protein [Spirochaeta isovalerica]MBB6480637.1 tetratricopeptide (TPR) repeat protein [Spirochaeta isovalerica]
MKKILLPFLAFLVFGCSSVPEEIASEYYNIGNAYFDVGDYDKAIEYYTKAQSEGHPYINKIRFNLAVAYTESGRVSQGLKLFESLLEQDPENLILLQSKAYSLYLMGDDDGAVEIYDQILNMFEYDATALLNKAKIIRDVRIDESIKLLEKLYQIEQDSDTAVLLGELYRENDQVVDFVRLYEEVILKEPANSSVLLGLAQHFSEEQLYFKAVEYYNRIADLKDYENLAEVLFRKAEIELCELDESKTGYDTLVLALDAGFSDKQRIKDLSEREELSDNIQLIEYLRVRGFL